MVARILTAAMAAVWAAFAFVGRAEVVSNCFSVVEYGDRCTHLVCDLEPFAGMEFVLDLSGDGIKDQISLPVDVRAASHEGGELCRRGDAGGT